MRVLFQHGRFTASDTGAVVLVQQAYLVQLPLYLVGILGGRMLMALNAYRFLFWLNAIAFTLNGGFDWLLSRLFGLPGIALANSAVFLVSTPAILWVLRGKLREMGKP